MVQSKEKQPQISAYVSLSTKTKLDQLTRTRGLRKNFVLEQALLYHFRALEELPEEAFLPPQVVLSRQSAQILLELVENPPAPTEAMKELMNERSDSTSGKDR
jgi:uncharacterized protein (DUF1778 family)